MAIQNINNLRKPVRRLRPKQSIIYRISTNPICKCEEEVLLIYDRASRLLDTVEEWKDNSLSSGIVKNIIPALRESIYITLARVEDDVNALIEEYGIEDDFDKREQLDFVSQLKERAEELFTIGI